MRNRNIWRPLNTYGLVFIGAAVAMAIVYTILELDSACGVV
jgi:hypothetical protein